MCHVDKFTVNAGVLVQLGCTSEEICFVAASPLLQMCVSIGVHTWQVWQVSLFQTIIGNDY